MSIGQRLAKLEQTQVGDAGDGIIGVCRIDYDTGTGPEVIVVGATGERLTRAAFRERYPRGLLIERLEYGKGVAISSAPA